MHLVACATPQEPLEDAPRSALLAESTESESWDGFWSLDSYYARCTRIDGGVEWFEVADDEAAPVSRVSEPRVLALRPKTRMHARVSVVVAQSPDGRRMLVGGSAKRTTR
jgi:hypothetical protein